MKLSLSNEHSPVCQLTNAERLLEMQVLMTVACVV